MKVLTLFNRYSALSVMTILVLVLVPFSGLFTHWGPDSGAGSEEGNEPAGLLASRVAADEWPMFHGDARHTGYSESIVPDTNDILWTFPSGATKSSPVLYQDKVLVGSDNQHLYAVDIDSGQQVWKYNTYEIGGGKIIGTPLVYNDKVYLPGTDYEMHILDVNTGLRVDNYTCPQRDLESSPVGYKGYVYFGSSSTDDSNVIAIDATTDDLYWSYSIGATASGLESSPIAFSDMVVIGTGNDSLVAFDYDGFRDGWNDGAYTSEALTGQADGDILWVFNTSAEIISSPATDGTNIYFGCSDKTIYAVNVTTGGLAWKKDISGVCYSSPAIGGDYIYIGANRPSVPIDKGVLYSLRRDNGNQAFNYTFENAVGRNSPVVSADNKIMMGCRDGHMYVLNATPAFMPQVERLMWDYLSGMPVESSPALGMGRVFLAANNSLIAFGGPDFFVTYLNTSKENPFEGDTMEIITNVYNGGTVAGSVDLEFWYAKTDNSVKVLIDTVPVSLDPSSWSEVKTNWTDMPAGDYYIWVKLTNADPMDTDTTMNEWFKPVKVIGLYKDGWLSENRDYQNTGYSGEDISTNRTRWVYDAGTKIVSAPIIAKGHTIFVTSSGGVVTVDQYEDPQNPLATKLIWDYDTLENTGTSPVIVASESSQEIAFDRFFVVSNAGKITALDFFGNFKWEKALGEFVVSSPIAANGSLFITTQSGKLFSIDQTTSDVVWSRDLGLDDTSVAAGGGRLFASSINGDLLCLDARNGSTIWSYSLTGGRFFTPSVAGDMVIAGSDSQSVYAFDITPDDNRDGLINASDNDQGLDDADGAQYDLIWTASTPGSCHNPVSLDSALSRAYAGTSTGYLVSIDMSTGQVVWKAKLGSTVEVSPSVGHNYVYAYSDMNIYALEVKPGPSQTTNITWKLKVESEVSAPMSISDNMLYFTQENGKAVCIGALNLKPLANIYSPEEGAVYFHTTPIEFSGAGSQDPESKPLSYMWRSAVGNTLIYNGANETYQANLSLYGKNKITLTVYDDLMASDSKVVNITILKKVIDEFKNLTIPARCLICFGEDTGIVDITTTTNPLTTPDEAPYEVGPYVNYQFKRINLNEPYLIAWANLSVTYDDTELPFALNESRLALYYYNPGTTSWVKCSDTGVDVDNTKVWANRTDLSTSKTAFAVGTFENQRPKLTFPDEPSEVGANTYEFKIFYEDNDNEAPEFIWINVDGKDKYLMEPVNPEGTDYTWKQYKATIKVEEGMSSYTFEASDGTIGARNGPYDVPPPQNKAPIANAGPDQSVELVQEVDGWKVTVNFNGNGSFDENMDSNGDGVLGPGDANTLTYIWTISGLESGSETMLGQKPSYVFTKAGTYTVTLNVSDGELSDEDSMVVTVTGGQIVDDDDDDDDDNGITVGGVPLWIWILAIVVILLIIVIIIAILFTRRKQEEAALDEELLECEECGEAFEPDLEECPNCGAAVFPEDEDEVEVEDDGEEEELECPDCGAMVDPEDVECPECGEELPEHEEAEDDEDEDEDLDEDDEDDDEEEEDDVKRTALMGRTSAGELICPDCGAVVEEDDENCPECGEELIEAEDEGEPYVDTDDYIDDDIDSDDIDTDGEELADDELIEEFDTEEEFAEDEPEAEEVEKRPKKPKKAKKSKKKKKK